MRAQRKQIFGQIEETVKRVPYTGMFNLCVTSSFPVNSMVIVLFPWLFGSSASNSTDQRHGRCNTFVDRGAREVAHHFLPVRSVRCEGKHLSIRGSRVVALPFRRPPPGAPAGPLVGPGRPVMTRWSSLVLPGLSEPRLVPWWDLGDP